jgi:hypothetical protein
MVCWKVMGQSLIVKDFKDNIRKQKKAELGRTLPWEKV